MISKKIVKYIAPLVLFISIFGSALPLRGESGGVTPSNRPQIKAKLSRDTIMIGEQVVLSVFVDKDIAQIIDFPSFPDKKIGDNMELVSKSEIDTLSKDGRKLKLKVDYTITSFDEGIYSMGEFPVLYIDKNIVDTLISSDTMRLHVETYKIDTTKEDIKDITTPLETPFIFGEIKNVTLWTLAGLFVAALLIGVILFIRQRIKKKESFVLLPPHVEAINKLDALQNRKLWQNGETKEYYTNLTDIIRTYIERRFGLNAMEMTSDEILNAVKALELSSKDSAWLADILKISDLVKFAKHFPAPEDNQSVISFAYYFIEDTKEIEVIEPTENEEGGENNEK